MYLQINKDFQDKLKKLNNYSYSDILFRIYIHNHEQDIIPENREIFTAICEHAREEVDEAFDKFLEVGMFTRISGEDYFNLQVEDFANGKYKCPKSRKAENTRGYSRLSTKELINRQPEDLRETVRDYVDMRAAIRHKITPSALDKILVKLDDYAAEYMESHPDANEIDVKSCPDAIAKALKREHARLQNEHKDEQQEKEKEDVPSNSSEIKKCPDCGAKVSHEGGCVICPECGWSKCG